MKVVYKTLGGLFGVLAAFVLLGALVGGNPQQMFAALPLALLSAPFAWLGWRGAGRHEKTVDRLAREVEQFIRDANAARELPVPTPHRLAAGQGEALFATRAELFEIKTSSARGYIGTRVTIGGMPLLLGTSDRVGRKALATMGAGDLVLTARRLIFVGNERTVVVELAKLVSVEPLLDGVRVSAQGRVNPLTFKLSNGLLVSQLLKNVQRHELQSRALREGVDLLVL